MVGQAMAKYRSPVTGEGTEDWRSHVRVAGSCHLKTRKRHGQRGKEPVETRHNWHEGREEALVHGQVRASHAGHFAQVTGLRYSGTQG